MRTVRSKRANPGSRRTSFNVSRAAGLRSGATASSRSKISVSAGESLALAKNFSLLAGTNNKLRRKRDIFTSPLFAREHSAPICQPSVLGGKGEKGKRRKERNFSPGSLFARSLFPICPFTLLPSPLIRNRQSDHSLLLQLRQSFPCHSQPAAINLFVVCAHMGGSGPADLAWRTRKL